MKQLKSLGVRNLRSFSADEQLVEIKNINILVGKNSCGKSTFARLFPLLKQSIGVKTTKTPILWNGPILDFGDFSTATRDGESSITFDLNFNFNLKKISQTSPFIRFSFRENLAKFYENHFELKLSLSLNENKKNIINTISLESRCTKIIFQYEDSKFLSQFVVKFSDSKGNIQTLDLIKEIKEIKEYDDIVAYPFHRSNGIVPDLIEFLKLEKNGSNRGYRSFDDFIIHKIASILKKYVEEDISIEYICSQILWVEPKNFFTHLTDLFADSIIFKDKLNDEDIKEDIFINIYPLSVLFSLSTYLRYINGYLSDFLRKTNYIAPIRAVSERYYRYQNINVDEMDNTGMNLPMIINTLTSKEQKELSRWISDNFKFQLKLELSGQHYEIKIKEENDSKFHNISDMGFGYSQLLPIIVSVWLGNNKLKERREFIRQLYFGQVYVIEQPELHLHPALQYQFGVMLATIIKVEKNKNNRFIIETHSKAIIDALGDQIKKLNITHNDVGIYLFEKNIDAQTTIKQASFSEDGYLQDWPLGFLAP